MTQLRYSGFTLVEMLVALAIGASIAALSYRALQGIILADEKVSRVTEQLDSVDRVFQLLENDLHYTLPRVWTSGLGVKQPLEAKIADRQSSCNVLVSTEDDYVLQFIRGDRSNLERRRRSDLMIVGYRLTLDEPAEDGAPRETCSLWRDFWAPVDTASEPQLQQRLLLSGIRTIVFGFCDSSLPRDKVCPPSGWPVAGASSPPLPRMVSITMEVDNLDELTRLFSLPVPL